MVNVCTAKQMVKWFRRHTNDAVYLGVIWLVKSEGREVVPVVTEKTEVGQGVETTFHSNMPTCIREVLNEFKDVFTTDLPPRWSPV